MSKETSTTGDNQSNIKHTWVSGDFLDFLKRIHGGDDDEIRDNLDDASKEYLRETKIFEDHWDVLQTNFDNRREGARDEWKRTHPKPVQFISGCVCGTCYVKNTVVSESDKKTEADTKK